MIKEIPIDINYIKKKRESLKNNPQKLKLFNRIVLDVVNAKLIKGGKHNPHEEKENTITT